MPEVEGVMPNAFSGVIGMIRATLVLLALLVQDPAPRYETRERHDPNGINKWYLGREIAHVMGPGGIPWLDRPERENEENPARCIESLRLRPGDVVADLGAGSGYYSFRMAPRVGEKGRILAVEIQDEMIAELQKRIAKNAIGNVETVKGTSSDPKLPEAGVDLVILVDVYHELEFPYEVMSAVKKALKPGGRVAFVEFRKEDRSVPIKDVHKMTEEQIGKEMAAVGLSHLETIGILPWQHIAVYTNRDVAADRGTELSFRLRIPEERKAESPQMTRDAEWFLRKALVAAKVEPFTAGSRDGTVSVRLSGATPESSAAAKKACLAKGVLPVDVELESERAYGPGK
jgi:precorrin-6B methylase 2